MCFEFVVALSEGYQFTNNKNVCVVSLCVVETVVSVRSIERFSSNYQLIAQLQAT